MSDAPAHPKIYHITHVDNLASLVADEMLLSDAAMIKRGGPKQAIGMSGIKRRRIEEIRGRGSTGYEGWRLCPILPFVHDRSCYS